MERFLVVSLLCAMLLFGCAGQQEAQKAAAAPATTQTQPAAAASAPAAAAPAKAAETAPAPAEKKTEAAGASFTDLMGKRSTIKWKVDYDIASGATTTKMTQYVKGSDSRTDVAAGGQTARTYMLAGKYYSCMQQASAWTCFELAAPAATGSAKVESEPSKYDAVADGTMPIAGTTASCFKLTVEGSPMRYCFSKEGVPLYLSVSGQGMDTVMSATSYTVTVSDSDFTLPAQAQKMPSYGG